MPMRFKPLSLFAFVNILLCVSTIGSANEVRKFTLPNQHNPILFGWAAAIDGNTAVITDTGVPIQAGAADSVGG